MKALHESNIGAQSPFEFDLNGNIALCDSARKIEGINEFANHYVSEWLLWHCSGRLGTQVCDIAALIVSVISCKFLPNYSLDHKLEWIEKVFCLENLRENIPMQIADYSASTLAVLRGLRPAIAEETASLNTGECNELLQLALPIERMLVQGGDHRLAVDQTTQLNGYGCRPFPRPEAITFSSSTATSISKYAYDLAEKRRRQFITEAIANCLNAAGAALAQEIRDELFRQLSIEESVAEMVITASGTDSFLIAHGLTRLIADKPVLSIIVGVEESGSGVKLALQERHFADDTALSNSVHKGQLLSSENNPEHQIDIPVRDQSGEAIPTPILDDQVLKLVEANIAEGNFVVVHAMNHSKLGYSGPSRALLLELKQKFGSEVCIVVDACQMRLDREEIVEYLKSQMIVIVTGSKFFTGPPFCGAILIPEQLVLNIKSQGAKFDLSFNSYCAKEDWPKKLQFILHDSSKNFNLGSIFRWVAAISEMERYFAIPSPLRTEAVPRFCERVEEILLATPFIELHDPFPRKNGTVDKACGELSGRRMIFPFFLTYDHNGVRTVCTEKQVHQIYGLLNQDCSKLFSYKNAREFRLLAQMCHIGQPVSVIHRSGAKTAVLRISVGARVFSESFSNTEGIIVKALIDDELWQIGVILGKLELLLGTLSDEDKQ